MKLETAERIGSKNATIEELNQAFTDDHGRGEFIILSQNKETFIQAAGELDGPYLVEYREGDTKLHYQCPQDLSKPQVQSLFAKYLSDDLSWKTDVTWKSIEVKPWWKFW